MMDKLKTINSNELLKIQMKNSKFKKEYNNLQKEFILAKEIIELRQKANLTQIGLAKKAHTSQSAIARIESGAYKNISLRFLNKIASALNAVPDIHLKKI